MHKEQRFPLKISSVNATNTAWKVSKYEAFSDLYLDTSHAVQIQNFLQIWSHLQKTPLLENFIFSAVSIYESLQKCCSTNFDVLKWKRNIPKMLHWYIPGICFRKTLIKPWVILQIVFWQAAPCMCPIKICLLFNSNYLVRFHTLR